MKFTGITLFGLLTSTVVATGPCDIFASGGTPCVAAHSMIRALSQSYNGPLYRVERSSDKATRDIGVLGAGGFADATSQDEFCEDTQCEVIILYDQSGHDNHLTPAPAGGAKETPDNPANATHLPLYVGGNKVYGLWVDAGIGYRLDKTSDIATGDEPEVIYMVTSGTHYNGGCCFDYGNAETNNNDDGAATMEAVYFGNCNVWGSGNGYGPWVMADLENGLFGCNEVHYCSNLQPLSYPYVTAMVKGRSGNSFALKGGNAQSGQLTTFYDGVRPNGYSPMKKQGAIILGIGGDNSNGAVGTFFEGVMVSGLTSDAIDNAVQENIVAAGYGVKMA